MTAHTVQQSRKHKRKEYSASEGQVVIAAKSLTELQEKLSESLVSYPEQTKRYLQAGIKLVEAGSAAEARKKSSHIFFYFTDTGQYGFF